MVSKWQARQGAFAARRTLLSTSARAATRVGTCAPMSDGDSWPTAITACSRPRVRPASASFLAASDTAADDELAGAPVCGGAEGGGAGRALRAGDGAHFGDNGK